jgi:hypothetical protein
VDLNYLFHRHQVSLMRADAAISVSTRSEHEGTARCYEDRIRSLQLALGAGAVAAREA